MRYLFCGAVVDRLPPGLEVSSSKHTTACAWDFQKLSLFIQQYMGTHSSVLGKVKAVRKEVAPHLSPTIASTSCLSNSHFPPGH